jgi:hypothetical protein
MTFAFRIRVNRSPSSAIESGDSELPLAEPGAASLVLRSSSAGPGKPPVALRAADRYVLYGGGFGSEAEAIAAGYRFENALMIALARVRVGADFGDRAPKSMAFKAGLRMLQRDHGRRVVNDTHGLMTFEEDPSPIYWNFGPARGIAGVSPASFADAFRAAAIARPALNDRERLALVLFNASFFQPTADSRFLLLIMAIEALIEPAPRSAVAEAHVDAMIKATLCAADLPVKERTSIVGVLKWMKQQSISQAGKAMVETRLGTARLYHGMGVADFFTNAYEMRSNLVHGNQPYPSFNEVASIVAEVEGFVSDLLTVPIIGPD